MSENPWESGRPPLIALRGIRSVTELERRVIELERQAEEDRAAIRWLWEKHRNSMTMKPAMPPHIAAAIVRAERREGEQ